MNILLTTNKFQQLAGAELVTLEIAEHFRAQGHDVTIATWFAGRPMAGIARRLGVPIIEQPAHLNAFDFDLVWVQHHIAPVLRYELTPGCRERTFFAWRHLSVVGFFEMPGLHLQDLICDRAYAVSDESRDRLLELGVPAGKIEAFPNPAPMAFHQPAKPVVAEKLQTILLVSNHAPAEVMQATAILRSEGLTVRHVGRNGEGQSRVTPKLIDDFDAVLAIGKTVHYALCGHKPAYVYDHFGGPGYLDATNFASAAKVNFSGRCTGSTRRPEEIAHGLVDGFARANRFAATLPPAVLERYRLEPYLDDLCAAVPGARPNVETLALLKANQPMLQRERMLCAGAGVTYRGHHSFKRRFDAIREARAARNT